MSEDLHSKHRNGIWESALGGFCGVQRSQTQDAIIRNNNMQPRDAVMQGCNCKMSSNLVFFPLAFTTTIAATTTAVYLAKSLNRKKTRLDFDT